MDIVETIKKNKHYLKCKSIVKNWEKSFKELHSRTPSRYDIKEAPTNIKCAYKKYYQMKSEALENSLCITEFDDNNTSILEEETQIHDNSSSPINSLPELPSGQQLTELLCNVRKKETKDKSATLTPFSENLSKKLFKNSTFSIRNPKKNLKSLLKDTNCNTENTSNPDALVRSFIDVNYNFSKEAIDTSMSSPKSLADYTLFSDNTVIRHVDSGWLQRSTNLSIETTNQSDTNTITSNQFGISNMRVTNFLDKQCIDYVENSESEEEFPKASIKPALKKRKLNPHHISTTIPLQHDDCVAKSQSKEKEPSVMECESTVTKNNSRNKHKKCEDKSDEIPEILEYLPFGIEQNYVPRVTNFQHIVDSAELSSTPESEANVEKLKKKIVNGTINDNYVKINIEKKVFVRGKKNMSYSKYKKRQWKNLKASQNDSDFSGNGQITCYKCSGKGHFAKYCNAHKGDTLLPLENSQDDDNIPTLQDMHNTIIKETSPKSVLDCLSENLYQPSEIPTAILNLLDDTNNDVNPLYTSQNNSVVPKEVKEALEKFGHLTFKPSQQEAIMRILSGKSTLLISPTGSGKSLCYQLPAFMYSQRSKCVTLVISPLVSLMEDQVLSMPEFLKAGCLHMNQPVTHRRKVIECLKNGMINILLISPEALVSVESSNSFYGLFQSLPPIAFACIDEVHCLSQWSHNFRPSYLMICKVLKEKLNVKCILGLTATATHSTVTSIINHIGIDDGIAGVLASPALPDNLMLSVSFVEDKDKALVAFLTYEKIYQLSSIIVYCIRRDECERIASLLRSCLQESGKSNIEKKSNKRKRMSFIAEAYHAGMSGAQRKKIQKYFMDGTLKIIVATVAFGMGINKSDIQCIIHYNMPSRFESYVQEVGRAGRNGQKSYCHTFLSKSNSDKNELLKHIHANTIDRPTIRKLLEKMFIPCECKSLKSNTKCTGHEVGIPIDNTVEELDLTSENIATLLCYIELHSKQYIKVLNNAYLYCKITSYNGPQKILEAAKTCPPLAMAYILECKKNPEAMKKCVIDFKVVEVAAAIGWDSGVAKFKLKNLEWITENDSVKRSNLKVEFHTLGFRIKAPGDLSGSELDSVLDDLHHIVKTQEETMLLQLEECNATFYQQDLCNNLSDEISIERSNNLKQIIKSYFLRENTPTDIIFEKRPLNTEQVLSDINSLVSTYKDCKFTGRSIAKIFQGISSPNFPAIIWGRTRFWRSHLHEDFNGILKLATQQIIDLN